MFTLQHSSPASRAARAECAPTLAVLARHPRSSGLHASRRASHHTPPSPPDSRGARARVACVVLVCVVLAQYWHTLARVPHFNEGQKQRMMKYMSEVLREDWDNTDLLDMMEFPDTYSGQD